MFKGIEFVCSINFGLYKVYHQIHQASKAYPTTYINLFLVCSCEVQVVQEGEGQGEGEDGEERPTMRQSKMKVNHHCFSLLRILVTLLT
jgi:hypothetical protein